jgi:hypothetical protein
MSMNDEVIRQTLHRWNAAMQECDARMDQLAELTGQVSKARSAMPSITSWANTQRPWPT